MNLSLLLSLTRITTNRSSCGCVDYLWNRVGDEKEKVNLFGRQANIILEESDAKFLAIYILFNSNCIKENLEFSTMKTCQTLIFQDKNNTNFFCRQFQNKFSVINFKGITHRHVSVLLLNIPFLVNLLVLYFEEQ